ncbi:hypothetical protein [Sphingobacterium lumbrici]|nr:hypothetical protein [Sphingobacterium lumbrici]
MSKLVASVVPMMNRKEIKSQTLTADTESNLLKLKALAGLITDEEQKR